MLDVAIHRDRASFNLRSDNLLAPPLPLGGTGTTLLSSGTTLEALRGQIISHGSLSCALRDTSMRRIALFIYEKDIARQGLVSERTRPVVSNGRRRKMIRANDTSHEYGRLWRMFVNYDSCPRGRKSYSWVGFRVPLWGFTGEGGGSWAGEKGSGSMSLWNFKRMPATRLRNDATMWRCGYNTVILCLFLVQKLQSFSVIISALPFLRVEKYILQYRNYTFINVFFYNIKIVTRVIEQK